MTTALYLAAVHPRTGESLIALGIMELLANAVDRLGYFRPVASGEVDHRIALMRDRCDLGDRALHGYTDAETDQLLAIGNQDARAKADCRHIVLPEGTDPRILKASVLLTRRGVSCCARRSRATASEMREPSTQQPYPLAHPTRARRSTSARWAALAAAVGR